MQTTMTETPAKGLPGTIANSRPYTAGTGINNTASPIRPGTFVCRAATTAGLERTCKPPAVAGDVTGGAARGFVIHSPLHLNPTVNTNVDRAYYQPEESFPVMDEGTMLVQCETAWTAGAQVFVRFTTVGLALAGNVRNDADTSGGVDRAVAAPWARFEDTGSGAGIATIKFKAPTLA